MTQPFLLLSEVNMGRQHALPVSDFSLEEYKSSLAGCGGVNKIRTMLDGRGSLSGLVHSELTGSFQWLVSIFCGCSSFLFKNCILFCYFDRNVKYL